MISSSHIDFLFIIIMQVYMPTSEYEALSSLLSCHFPYYCSVVLYSIWCKLKNLSMEMQKNDLSVLGVSELRWKGQGEIRSDYTVYYSRGERAERGVAIVVHNSILRSVVKKIICNDRIMAFKLKTEPVSLLIMQVYMPTSEYEDDEVEKLYHTIEEILEEDGKGDTNNIILEDWNSVVGDESYRNIVGSHGIGKRNHRGQMLVDICEKMD